MSKLSDQVKDLEAERDRLAARVRELETPKKYAYYVGGPYDLTKRAITKTEPTFIVAIPNDRPLGPYMYGRVGDPCPTLRTGYYRLQGHLRDNVLIYEWAGAC